MLQSESLLYLPCIKLRKSMEHFWFSYAKRNTEKRTCEPMSIVWALSDMHRYFESCPELPKDKINEKYNYITHFMPPVSFYTP